MKIFVSYTQRDGYVNKRILLGFKSYLIDIFKDVFVHALEEKKKYEQLYVIKNLLLCNVIILIYSPSIEKSPWVKLELFIGKILCRPIIQIHYSYIQHFDYDI